MKLYLEASVLADNFATVEKDGSAFTTISSELLNEAFTVFEESIPADPLTQHRCIERMSSTLLILKNLSSEQYEKLITKTAQFAAKVVSRPEQCKLVALCAYLFYPIGESECKQTYNNSERALECLQRALKLADAVMAGNPSQGVGLFVHLLEHYIYFFEQKNPSVSHAYVSGLVALVKEHLRSQTNNTDQNVTDAKHHFADLILYLRKRKAEPDTSNHFAAIQTENK